MFFANPVPAMRNVRRGAGARRPPLHGRLAPQARERLDAPGRAVVEQFVEEAEDSDEPTCGPGPFSMGDADVTSQILLGAGFEEISLRRCDTADPDRRDLDEAVEFAMALGPAGEVIRLAGEEAERIRPEIAARCARRWPEFAAPRRGLGAGLDLDRQRPRPGLGRESRCMRRAGGIACRNRRPRRPGRN